MLFIVVHVGIFALLTMAIRHALRLDSPEVQAFAKELHRLSIKAYSLETCQRLARAYLVGFYIAIAVAVIAFDAMLWSEAFLRYLLSE